MFWKVVRATAALAAVAVASSVMPLGTRGGGAYDSHGLMNNYTDAAVFGITDREIVLDHQNSMAERKKRKSCRGGSHDGACTRHGGSCLKNAEAEDCDGLLIPSLCKGSSCQCCIPLPGFACKGTLIGGQCFTFSQEALNWADAGTACKAAGGRLAIVQNPSDLLSYVVQTYGEGTVIFWVGGSDIGTEGTWVWNNGVPIPNDLPWEQSNPDSCCGGQDCLAVNYKGGYDDDGCNVQRRYICETDRSSNHHNITCPERFENIGNCCYYFSVDNGAQKANWPDAKGYCKALGREHNLDIDLFEVGTGGCEGDVNLMMDIAEKRAYTWAGANSLDRGANWQWERTGDVFPLNCNMWYPGDPRTDNANCMHAFITDWTKWRAYFGIAKCETQINHFVCQVFK